MNAHALSPFPCSRLLPALAASLLLAAASASQAGTGIAIALGLNAVDPAAYAGWSGDLVACENDAKAMLDIARAQGFQTVELLTKQATKAALKNALDEAAPKLKKGDTLVLSYSGHGGQVPDLNGDEDDGLDETWCLYDGQLLDDVLASYWKTFAAGVRICVFSDSCHSGTVIKNFSPAMRAAADSQRYRYIPEEVQKKVLALPAYQDFGKDAPSEKAMKQATQAAVILISGCADDQLSMDGLQNGLFTEHLLGIWKGGAFKGSYRDFQQKIRAEMPASQKPEFYVWGPSDPQFEGEKPWTR